jgi:hypothetical protein
METEMDAELRIHIEAFAKDLVRIGLPREVAMRRARIEFGGGAFYRRCGPHRRNLGGRVGMSSACLWRCGGAEV